MSDVLVVRLAVPQFSHQLALAKEPLIHHLHNKVSLLRIGHIHLGHTFRMLLQYTQDLTMDYRQ